MFGWLGDGWNWLRDGVTSIFDEDGKPNSTAPASGGSSAPKASTAGGALLIAAGVAVGYLLARK